VYVLILIALLSGGTGEGNNFAGATTSTALFKNKASCEAALATVESHTEGVVDGLCVPQKVKKVKHPK